MCQWVDGSSLVSRKRWPQASGRILLYLVLVVAFEGFAVVVCHFPGTLGNKILSPQHNVKAVSYTHLDVYKRQGLHI